MILHYKTCRIRCVCNRCALPHHSTVFKNVVSFCWRTTFSLFASKSVCVYQIFWTQTKTHIRLHFSANRCEYDIIQKSFHLIWGKYKDFYLSLVFFSCWFVCNFLVLAIAVGSRTIQAWRRCIRPAQFFVCL